MENIDRYLKMQSDHCFLDIFKVWILNYLFDERESIF